MYTPKLSLNDLCLAVQTNDKNLRTLLENNQACELSNVYILLFNAINVGASKETFQNLVHYFNQQQLSLDTIDQYGRTAFDDACIDGNLDAIEILIKGGADYQRTLPNSSQTYLEHYLQRFPDNLKKIHALISEQKIKLETQNQRKTGWSLTQFFISCSSLLQEVKDPGYKKISGDTEKKDPKYEPITQARIKKDN